MKKLAESNFVLYTIKKPSQVYAFMLALYPLLSSIRMPFSSSGMSYIFCMITSPFLVMALLIIKSQFISRELIFVYIYFVYFVIRAGGDYTNSILMSLVCIINILAIYNKLIDIRILYQTIYLVTLLACGCVILQNIVHLVIGIHIPMMFSSLVSNPEVAANYDFLFRTGFDTSGSYRPSAFFFEPAQFCQYCFIGLAIALRKCAKENAALGVSLFITLGMLLSVSSMGVGLVLGCWLWATFVRGDKALIRRILQVIIFIGVLAIIVYIMFIFNILNMDMLLSRVIGEYNGYNAFAGRNFAADWYLTDLNSISKWIGVGYSNRPDVYMVGITTYRYTIGYIGCALFFLMLLTAKKKLSDVSTVITVGYMGLLFLASCVSILSLVFYVGMSYLDTKNTVISLNHKEEQGVNA